MKWSGTRSETTAAKTWWHGSLHCRLSMLAVLTSHRQSQWKDFVYEILFYIPFDTKQVILETFFPATLLADTEETTLSTTKANIHPEHKIPQHKINTYEDMGRRYCCLTSFFLQLLTYALVAKKIQPNKVVRRCRDGDFFASCISSEPHAAHFRPAS